MSALQQVPLEVGTTGRVTNTSVEEPWPPKGSFGPTQNPQNCRIKI